MTFDIEVAARTIYGEARNQPDEGMQAVAWVLVNRLHAKRWYSGQTLAETAMFCVKGSQYHQFSCWNTDDPNLPIMLRISDNSPILDKCRNFVQGALAGTNDDPTKGATHYKRVGTNAAWASGQTPVVTIGDHEFYRGIA